MKDNSMSYYLRGFCGYQVHRIRHLQPMGEFVFFRRREKFRSLLSQVSMKSISKKNTYRKEDSDSQTLLVIDPSARCGFVCPKIFMPHIFLNCSILNISGFKHVHSIKKKLKIPKISLLRRPFQLVRCQYTAKNKTTRIFHCKGDDGTLMITLKNCTSYSE